MNLCFRNANGAFGLPIEKVLAAVSLQPAKFATFIAAKITNSLLSELDSISEYTSN